MNYTDKKERWYGREKKGRLCGREKKGRCRKGEEKVLYIIDIIP